MLYIDTQTFIIINSKLSSHWCLVHKAFTDCAPKASRNDNDDDFVAEKLFIRADNRSGDNGDNGQ